VTITCFICRPTSGLDSTTTKQIVTQLSQIATNASITVAAVLHQPSDKVFSIFTNLILLARGGSLLYIGDTTLAAPYFRRHGFDIYAKDYSNQADFLMDIVEGVITPDCNQDGGKWCINYDFLNTPYIWWREYYGQNNDSIMSKTQSTTKENSILGTPFTQQLKVFFCRSFYLMVKSTSISDFLLVAFVAMMVSVARIKLIETYGNNLVSANMGNQALALGVSMVAAVQSIPEFEIERLTFERERSVGLNVYAFVAAKFAVALYGIVIMPLVFTIIYAAVMRLHIFISSLFINSHEGNIKSYKLLPRSVASISGIATLYWMLIVNTFTTSSYAMLISFIFPADKSMLAAVLMLIFMNLASSVSVTLGELSYMNTLSMWSMVLDASEHPKSPLTAKQIVNIILQYANECKRHNQTLSDSLEMSLPRIKTDEDVMRSYGINRDSGFKCELSMLFSGVIMRAIAVAYIVCNYEIMFGLLIIYMTMWLCRVFQIKQDIPVTEAEILQLQHTISILETLDTKTDEELFQMQKTLLSLAKRQRPETGM
jgi:hypothetical protein